MAPLELLGLGYVIFATLAFTSGMLVLAYFGLKSLIGTISVKVTEETKDREQVSNKFTTEFSPIWTVSKRTE